MRAIAAALLGLTLATPSVAQTTPQNQTPSLQQRGQQLLQGLTGDENRNSDQGAPGAHDRGRGDTARRPNDDREQGDRYGNTQRSYRDQRQSDQGYREPSDRSSNTQRPHMQHAGWDRTTVQPFLDVRTAVLNDTLENAFHPRYPGFRPANDDQRTTTATA